jgi:hypothetical protein
VFVELTLGESRRYDASIVMSETLAVTCRSCGKVVAEVVGRFSREVRDEDGRFECHEVYMFARCPHCSGPILTERDVGPYDEIMSEVTLYPERRQADYRVPEPMRTAFNEACACFESKHYRPAAVMCRGVLEGLCDHLLGSDGQGWRLARSLAELESKGLIEKSLLEWSKSLHLEGNRAAHDFKVAISPEDAEDVFEFTDALLNYIFVVRDRFDAYKERAAKRAGAKTSGAPTSGPR